MRFQWDASKAESNRKKHGVTFEEAVTVFYDPLAATFHVGSHDLGTPVSHELSPLGSPRSLDDVSLPDGLRVCPVFD